MYTKYYGLTKKPFENTPDPDFLFLSKNHREVLASLEYAINAAKGFVLVVGDIGTGKTTLIHALIKQLDPSFIILNITNPRATYKDILHHLGKKIGIASEKAGPLETVEAIQNKLETLHERGNKHVVLIVDEAHLLSNEALGDIRLISNIENEERKLIQIILVGQNELSDKLRKESLRPLQQRLVVTRRLFPLNRNETQEYILHRLRVAGRQSQLFEIKALSLIWKKSRGIPRLINQICDNAMLIGYAVEARSIGGKIIREVIGDMESVYRVQMHGPVFLHRRLKWIGAVAVAVLLMVYPETNLFNGKPFFVKSRIFRKDSVPAQTKTPIALKNSLTRQNGELPAKGSSPVEVGVSSRQVVPNAFSDTTEKPSADKLQVSRKERFGEKHKPSSIEKQALESKDNGATGKLQDRVGEKNNGINPLQKPADLDGPALSKTACEKAGDIRKRDGNNRRKVSPNECLYDLARKEYGIGNISIIDLIQKANPGIRDVNRIYPGQEITLPHFDRKDLIVKDEKGIYRIHYASFYRRKDATFCIQELIEKNQEAFVISVQQGDNLVYRVYLGQFESRDDAEKVLDKTELKYFNFLP